MFLDASSHWISPGKPAKLSNSGIHLRVLSALVVGDPIIAKVGNNDLYPMTVGPKVLMLENPVIIVRWHMGL